MGIVLVVLAIEKTKIEDEDKNEDEKEFFVWFV